MNTALAPLFATDAYKLSHREQYLTSGNVTRVYSNLTHRRSRIAGLDGVIHFGLQAFLQQYCTDAFAPFFAANEDAVASGYQRRVAAILGAAPSSVDASHIRSLHRLGYLPLEFRAVPEGTLVPCGVPVLTVENTLDEFFWLPNFIETTLSASLWHPSTTATLAYRLRRLLDERAAATSAAPAAVEFQAHDFSYRGQTSNASAAASGAGHLLSFLGSDTLPALDFVDAYYPAQTPDGNGLVLASVPATEHSVMSTGIAVHGERETFRRLLDLYPSGIVSVVSDTFDLWRVLTDYLPSLRSEVLGRDGKLVIRPDSGDPADILCGTRTNANLPQPATPPMRADDPAYYGVIDLLWETFGGTVNAKGFRELDPRVGAIYGDSITFDRADDITARLARMGYASTNVVFGVGSYTYQFVTRDTFNSAVKATWARVDGEGVNIFKDPATGDGTKTSATGRLAVVRHGDRLRLIDRATPAQEAASLLQPVWRDGAFVRTQSFADVRRTLRENLS
ncbi:nicotinate phosphoribosyltransferase [Micrococcales bacterium 31B]|nr:nicotinate phosphoribosyltransferase [Micrococcales bacterium 31B]